MIGALRQYDEDPADPIVAEWREPVRRVHGDTGPRMRSCSIQVGETGTRSSSPEVPIETVSPSKVTVAVRETGERRRAATCTTDALRGSTCRN
jgi:hypothetical protein